MGVSHVKTSPIADGTNTDLIRPSDWNSAHTYNIAHSELASSTAHHIDLANSETTYVSGTVSLSALTNITIRSTTGQAYQFSVANQSAQTGLSALYDGANSISSGTVRLTNANGVSFSINGQTLSGSVAAQTNQSGGIYVTAQSTGQSSSSTYDARSLSIIPDGILSAGWSNGSFRISAPAQTALTATTVSSVSSANAVGANNSRFALEAHIHEGVRRIGISTQGNTAGNTGFFPGSNVQLVGSNGITISGGSDAQSNVTLTLSGITQSVQTQGITADELSVGVSTGGNTAGNTTVQTGQRLVFVGSNMVSISEATGAGSTTLQISATQSVQTQGTLTMYANSNTTQSSTGTANISSLNFAGAGIASVGVTNGSVVVSVPSGGGAGDGGNTIAAGTRTASSSAALLISDSNNVSWGLNAVNGTILTASVGGLFSAGVSTGGNTQGNTGMTGTRLDLVGSAGITLSQNTDANGGTITIKDAAATLSQWDFGYPALNISAGIQPGNASVQVMPFFANDFVTASRARMFISASVSTSSNSSHGGTLSIGMGIYTKNASTLSLASSASNTYVWTNTSNNSTSVLSGMRAVSMSWANLSITPGEYWVAWWSRTSTVNANWLTASNMFGGWLPNAMKTYSGDWQVATNASNQMGLGVGIYSATTAGPLPNSMAFSDVQGQTNGPLYPILSLANYTVP